MRSEFQGRRRAPRRLCIGAALLAILPVGCQTDNPSVSIDVAVYRRAEVDRVEQLEAHLERLQADLRRAEEALGDDFDIREFHDRVLAAGGVTLPMLGATIEAWIARKAL